ncbi:MAG: enoyl-CoA hydratase/isomerase family protein [Candidatus Tectomicrobia bacterium]|nr:enoyl-CoA hydratase/isomerase family protein [Candidatus Tectomicrobia bacterium]
MAYETLIYEKKDSIAKITMNRPEKLNALSGELLADLRDALDEVEKDHDVRVLILTGNGRAFSSGFDLTPGREREHVPPTSVWDTTHLAPRTLLRLWYLRQPTIAAVNGFAMAAGNVLAMSCDILIASEEAVFAEPEIRHVAHSPAIVLPWITSNKHLNWFYLTGDTIDARTAERWNMVNKVVSPDKLQEEAWKAAERIAKVPPFAVQIMKKSIKQAYDKMGFSESVEHHLVIRMAEQLVPGVPEKDQLGQIRQSQGMRAFLEARDGPFRD